MDVSRGNDTKTFYEDFTSYLFKDRIYDNPRHLKLLEFLDSFLKGRTVKSILEVGCGIGVISERLLRYTPSLYCIDISERSLQFASRTVKEAHFVCCDLLQLSLVSQFELITLFDVLEHIPKKLHQQAFTQLKAHSKDGTIIIVTIPSDKFLDYLRLHFPDRLQIIDESITFEDMLHLIQDNGFELLAFKQFGVDYEEQYQLYVLRLKQDIEGSYQPKAKGESGNIRRKGFFRVISFPQNAVLSIRARIRLLRYGRIAKDLDIS
jgi:trans-aconitate 2-methyltransferase